MIEKFQTLWIAFMGAMTPCRILKSNMGNETNNNSGKVVGSLHGSFDSSGRYRPLCVT